MSIHRRNNINIVGSGRKTLLLAHGFGCDQNMWRLILPVISQEHRVILFDHVGSGRSDLSAYDREKYSTLHGYADDVLEILAATDSPPAIFIGHSVGASIGILSSIKKPEAFEKLILVGPSPSYINDVDYVGGFDRSDIDSLLETLDSNYLGWSRAIAPAIMGNSDRPELGEELTKSFCSTDPEIAKHFAQVTFLSDNREDLALVKTPTLILQCLEDIIAPAVVGAFVHRQIPDSRIVTLQAYGHCPHLSAPEETLAAIQQFLTTP